MSLIDTIKSPILHRIAKVDAGESVANYAPLRTKVLPIAGLGLGLAAMGYNYHYAADDEAKSKVLLRDGLVVGGVTAATIAASYLVNRTRASHWIAEQVQNLGKGLAQRFQSKSALAKHAKEAATKAHHHCHHHGHDHIHPFAKAPTKMLGSLFKSDKHSHGGEAAVALTLLSAIPIFLGGVPAGAIADWMNKEDWRQTLPMKLKEGTFQFLGNITVCTVAILGFSTVGKTLAKKLWNYKGIQDFTKARMQRHLQALAKSPKGNLGLIPTKLTEDIEGILIKHRNEPAKISKALQEYFHHYDQEWQDFYRSQLSSLLNEKTIDRSLIHAKIRSFVEPKLRQSINTCLTQLKNGDPKSIETLARLRFDGMADTMGVLAGVVSGVVGGAWVSNQVNETATKVFKWPEGHVTSGLFQHSKSHGHSHNQAEDANQGWLAGTVGNRGIHWYDGILHLDDIPSALYIGGMHAVESMIQLLYGISGFLAGTAGIDYSKNKPTQQSPAPSSTVFPAFQPPYPYGSPFAQQTIYHFHSLPPKDVGHSFQRYH